MRVEQEINDHMEPYGWGPNALDEPPAEGSD